MWGGRCGGSIHPFIHEKLKGPTARAYIPKEEEGEEGSLAVATSSTKAAASILIVGGV